MVCVAKKSSPLQSRIMRKPLRACERKNRKWGSLLISIGVPRCSLASFCCYYNYSSVHFDEKATQYVISQFWTPNLGNYRLLYLQENVTIQNVVVIGKEISSVGKID
mgnify:CR=1 FL=1